MGGCPIDPGEKTDSTGASEISDSRHLGDWPGHNLYSSYNVYQGPADRVNL